MKLFLIMGTHMAEIRHCIDHLTSLSKESGPVETHIPMGIDWELKASVVKQYSTEDVLWVFDPEQVGTVFIVIDPRQPLIGQLEHLADNLRKCLIEPLKIVTCVDCASAEQSAVLRAWLEACIYYSDLVLLGNRQEASKRFVRDFQKGYERRCFPSLFLMLKGKGIPSSAEEILTPGTRRISQMFDLPETASAEIQPGMVIEASCDLDLEEFEADPYRFPEEDEAPVPVPVPAGDVRIQDGPQNP